MDKIRRKEKRKYLSKRNILIVLGVIIVVLLFGFVTETAGQYTVDRQQLTIGEVRQGPFTVNIRSSGQLVSLDKVWIASLVEGRIKEVFIKTGDVVELGQPIAQINNPELLRARDTSKWEIEAVEAENAAKKVEFDSQILDQKAKLLEIELALDRIKLRLEAEKDLLSQGNSTVSLIQYKENRLVEKQLEKTLEIESERLKNLELRRATQMESLKARFNVLQRALEQANKLVENMTIKASKPGQIIELNVETGQRIEVGSNVAEIVNQESLVAELKISELNIHDVEVGQSVVVNTRKSEIAGEVERIEPGVINGQVKVYVKLNSELPRDARIDLSVNGLITVADLDHALYVQRPYLTQSFSVKFIYKMTSDEYAVKSNVEFGVASAEFIQVLKGLSPGEKIVLQDTSSWGLHPEVRIK